MTNFLGKAVRVKLNDAGKRRVASNVDFLDGCVKPEVDWLVGCPVFVSGNVALGVGYECEVVQIEEQKDAE